MRRLTTNHGTQDDHGIVTIVERHLVSPIDQFKGTGNGLHMDILRQSAMLLEGVDTTLEKGTCNLRIPLSHDHTEDHV